MNFILRFLIFVSLCYVAESVMCYICADSTGDKGGNQCQAWYKTMNYYRNKFEKTGKYSTEKYVKNCTNYGGQGADLCMVASVEERGNIRSFIRDCGDGVTFFSDDIDTYFERKILPDNQTTCQYTGQGYLACVTVCDPMTQGDFCNGQVTDSSTQCVPNIVLLMSLVFAIFLDRTKML